MNKKFILTVLLVIFSFALTGCGTKVIALNDEETSRISTYSAKIVAKYNKDQKDGIVLIDTAEIEKELKAEEKAAKKKAKEEAEKAESESQNSDNANAADTKSNLQTVTLEQALSLDGVKFTYTGADLLDVYQTDTVYISPETDGDKFLCMRFKVTNTSSNDASVDILSQKPSFSVIKADGSTVKSATTIITEDLSTYQGVLSANASEDLVLLFEVGDDTNLDNTNISLQITLNSVSYLISLEG